MDHPSISGGCASEWASLAVTHKGETPTTQLGASTTPTTALHVNGKRLAPGRVTKSSGKREREEVFRRFFFVLFLSSVGRSSKSPRHENRCSKTWLGVMNTPSCVCCLEKAMLLKKNFSKLMHREAVRCQDIFRSAFFLFVVVSIFSFDRSFDLFRLRTYYFRYFAHDFISTSCPFVIRFTSYFFQSQDLRTIQKKSRKRKKKFSRANKSD